MKTDATHVPISRMIKTDVIDAADEMGVTDVTGVHPLHLFHPVHLLPRFHPLHLFHRLRPLHSSDIRFIRYIHYVGSIRYYVPTLNWLHL